MLVENGRCPQGNQCDSLQVRVAISVFVPVDSLHGHSTSGTGKRTQPNPPPVVPRPLFGGRTRRSDSSQRRFSPFPLLSFETGQKRGGREKEHLGRATLVAIVHHIESGVGVRGLRPRDTVSSRVCFAGRGRNLPCGSHGRRGRRKKRLLRDAFLDFLNDIMIHPTLGQHQRENFPGNAFALCIHTLLNKLFPLRRGESPFLGGGRASRGGIAIRKRRRSIER
mmetsp:Transcript_26193/g.66569  ORF Transcript_26193/g.66569 Transcript_26193/m.66569 type:complete len:223 (-) Transcript_26193:1813-2481(-)